MENVLMTSPESIEKFNMLRGTVGADVATFIMCAWLDVPYEPEIASGSWDGYLKRINKKYPGKKFPDGRTDIRSALDEGLADMDRWQREWGVGDEDNAYSPSDYRRLDEIFKTLAARLQGSGGYDAQQEFTLRNCSHMALLREKCIRKGDKESVSKAKDLDKMIADNLAAENLRKKDEKPQQTARLDGIVEAAYKKYGIGISATKDQVMEAIVKWLNERKRYANSQDAAEQAILAILNCTRMNSDLPLLDELPYDARLDQYSGEFDNSPESVRSEQKTYDYLNLHRRPGTAGRR
ncbi:MAG: hypothetical protein IIW82_08085 [Clostridia bacterium]|nr:hypothetical protein [Clostridia bacterium]MBQ5887587.1 hypothetical protein [Clostridia bacterium]